MRDGARRLLAALATALLLAGCDTAAERAEAHYQRGMALLAEGDADRAMVEFRNVFRLNGDHTAARMEYAGLLVEQGRLEEAFGQYLRLVEQDWNSAEGHHRLADLALATGDYDAARTHAEAAHSLDPANAAVRAIKATLDFRDGAHAAAAEMARGVLEEIRDSVPAHAVLIAERMEADDPDAALALAETALALAPQDEVLALAKLGVLEALGDPAPIGAYIEDLVARFPENGGLRRARIAWHVEQGDIDRAERMVRAEAARAPDDPSAALSVVRFLLETRGPEAVRAELERLIAESEDSRPFRQALAGLDIREGRVAEGREALEALVAEAEPSDDRRDIQVALAGVLRLDGDPAGGDALVEAVLAEDASHVGALKLRAERLIAADRPDEAIQNLRLALNQEPRDSETLLLMAAAHERAGAPELAQERLALAVEVSGRGVAESLEYARFLLANDRADLAEQVMANALRVSPDHPDLLLMLGQVHLASREWARAERVAARLRGQGDPLAEAMATTLEAGALQGQDRFGETIALLETLADEGGRTVQAMNLVVETYLQADNLAGARTYLADIVAGEPGNLAARTLQASLAAFAGDTEAAETAYRAIVAADAGYAPAYRGLFALLALQGRQEDAAAALEMGLAATGRDPEILFLKADLLEQQQDFEGAITVYEDLYARDTSSLILANNLASLLATHRPDPASLERAFAIAQRLRGTDVPQFQDTYGWILSRLGRHEEALAYLEPAASALPEDPLVQFHLGITHHHLQNRDEARESLARAVAQAEAHGLDTLPQMREAHEILAASTENEE